MLYFLHKLFIDVHNLEVEGHLTDSWKLEVHPKVRSFLWKMCHDVLPTRTNLERKGVACPYHCVWCLIESEATCHTFFWSVLIVWLCGKRFKCGKWSKVWDWELLIFCCSSSQYVTLIEQCETYFHHVVVVYLAHGQNHKILDDALENPYAIIAHGIPTLEEWNKARGGND